MDIPHPSNLVSNFIYITILIILAMFCISPDNINIIVINNSNNSNKLLLFLYRDISPEKKTAPHSPVGVFLLCTHYVHNSYHRIP